MGTTKNVIVHSIGTLAIIKDCPFNEFRLFSKISDGILLLEFTKTDDERIIDTGTQNGFKNVTIYSPGDTNSPIF
jgi:hypothetical protein